MLDISNDEVLYFKSEFFLIKTTDYSCAAYVRVWQKNLKCRTFLSSFSGQVTQVRTQLLFTYIQSATLTVSKLRGWLVNLTPPLLWDHPCSVIFHHQGQILFSLLTCTPFLNLTSSRFSIHSIYRYRACCNFRLFPDDQKV